MAFVYLARRNIEGHRKTMQWLYIGACGIAWGEGVLTGVQLPGPDDLHTRLHMQGRFPGVPEAPPPAFVQAVAARVRALLEGEADAMLDVPLDMAGVPDFHREVYAIARAIPPGRTLTYGDIAARLGDPALARAVGQALGHNPFAPVVPCHRILGAGNSGTGFSATGGVATKLRMLQIEKAQLGDQPGLF